MLSPNNCFREKDNATRNGFPKNWFLIEIPPKISVLNFQAVRITRSIEKKREKVSTLIMEAFAQVHNSLIIAGSGEASGEESTYRSSTLWGGKT